MSVRRNSSLTILRTAGAPAEPARAAGRCGGALCALVQSGGLSSFTASAAPSGGSSSSMQCSHACLRLEPGPSGLRYPPKGKEFCAHATKAHAPKHQATARQNWRPYPLARLRRLRDQVFLWSFVGRQRCAIQKKGDCGKAAEHETRPGREHTFFVMADGRLACFGRNLGQHNALFAGAHWRSIHLRHHGRWAASLLWQES
jgi:hypothetical protein